MAVEAPISVDGVRIPLGRMMLRAPEILLKHRFFSGLTLWFNAKALRQYFDLTSPETDKHVHLLAIEGASSILARLNIPQLEKTSEVEAWRSFLSHIVAAADDGNIEKARKIFRDGEKFIPLIMNTSTKEEAQSLYEEYKKAPHKRSEIEAFAAYTVKMYRLLTKLGADEELEQEWWRSQFDTEAARLCDSTESGRLPEEFTLITKKIEEEYPNDEE